MSDESSKNARPLVSVITVVLNGEPFLEECIRSIHIQAGVACEHILIDGGSGTAPSESCGGTPITSRTGVANQILESAMQ